MINDNITNENILNINRIKYIHSLNIITLLQTRNNPND